MANGLDYASGRVSGATLAANGYSFVCRYMTDGGPDLPGKLLLPDERVDLHNNGISIILNFESTGQTARDGYDAGVVDAQTAVQTGINIGSPPGSVVYFSIDWDTTEGDQDAINAYFRGVNSVIGVAATGVYGSYYVCQRCLAAGVVSWTWQTLAWSGGQQLPGINILQDNNAGYVYLDGVECDVDISLTDNFGQWSPNAVAPPPPPPPPPPAPVPQPPPPGPVGLPTDSSILVASDAIAAQFLGNRNG
jgi:hypothetical protein